MIRSTSLFPQIFMQNYVMKFKGECTRVQLLAAFISAWLCSYCVPIGEGAYIRPKVFMAAASIAQGTRWSIGIASMAHLYCSLDDMLSIMFQPANARCHCPHIS